MQRLLAIFIFILALPTLGTPVSASPIPVPARLSEDGHFLVDFMVNGEGPYTFIVDSASGSTMVFDSFAVEAGLSEVESAERIMVQGASGVTEARQVSLGTLEASTWTFDIDTVIALPDVEHFSDIAGVLGVGVLFAQPVGFAASEDRLDIYAAAVGNAGSFDPASAYGGSWIGISTERRHGLFLWAQVEIDGVAFDAVIDTGARRSTINPAGAAALGVEDLTTAGLAEDEPIRGATDDPIAAWSLPVGLITLGAKEWSEEALTASDVSIFQMLRQETTPTIILGSDLLSDQYFIIDSEAERLWLQASPAS